MASSGMSLFLGYLVEAFCGIRLFRSKTLHFITYPKAEKLKAYFIQFFQTGPCRENETPIHHYSKIVHKGYLTEIHIDVRGSKAEACEKRRKTPQKDAKINLERRTKKVLDQMPDRAPSSTIGNHRRISDTISTQRPTIEHTRCSIKCLTEHHRVPSAHSWSRPTSSGYSSSRDHPHLGTEGSLRQFIEQVECTLPNSNLRPITSNRSYNLTDKPKKHQIPAAMHHNRPSIDQ
ncbi:hypothetical protein LXL04_030342 [Taraxacum kok-saghyz]